MIAAELASVWGLMVAVADRRLPALVDSIGRGFGCLLVWATVSPTNSALQF